MTTETENLSLANVMDDSQFFDWSEADYGSWDVVYPAIDFDTLSDYGISEADAADAACVSCPQELDSDDLRDVFEEWNGGREFYEWEDSFSPMMNYRYPVALPYGMNETDAATALDGLPLVLIECRDGGDSSHYLALTGGGMNLSWEICAAYIACGCVPPIHFLENLPHMSDNPEKKFPQVLAAMPRAAEFLKHRAERLTQEFVQFQTGGDSRG